MTGPVRRCAGASSRAARRRMRAELRRERWSEAANQLRAQVGRRPVNSAPEMGAAVVAAVCVVSMAVAAAASIAVSPEAPPGPYHACAIMALCVFFHGGMALLIHGIRRGGAPLRRP
ncbi:hypothetical protein E2562_000442 [Oryza meyeriana var. granulata]|uniref:Uncharacterized protein n=1 Tax=Oryza meyeriana var. granulata TaxID=110450 RepID=A0A6G1CC02_9ORYZ|nr:hypothetical protein E2562_000442 [Oryza meyeriana var. granulata]